jgi:mono/diheme cytochrome c family protein
MNKWLVGTLVLIVTTLAIFATASAQGGDVERGRALYAQNCALCHGDRAQGRIGATLAKDFPGIRVDVLLKEIISNGVPGSVMPAWAKAKGGPLSDAEIEDIVSFIRSLGNVAPTVPAVATATRPPLPSPVATFPAGDAKRGLQIYNENCAVCHGPNGEGRIGATLSKDWAGINVVTLLDTTISRGVAGSKMPAWSQSYGGPLNNQQIADVAAYVLTLKKASAPMPASAPSQTATNPLSDVLALVCVGVLALIAIVVLMFGLASTRVRT